jgi:serine/threonine protein kinase
MTTVFFHVGFDVRGDIKIFDLGLAKELKPCQQVGIDQYHTSGIAGTRRYMAPEVAQVIPYGFSADVSL